MSTIVTRAGKGSALTHNEVDANFNNLNNDKVEKSGTDPVVISVNSGSDALRITQTGSGNALLVEDSTNPDSTPFVIDASGNVGIGTSSPKSLINATSGSGAVLTLENSSTSLGLGSTVGQIDFYANDASVNGTGSKSIISCVSESSGGQVVALTFGTSDSSSSTSVERMRINNIGNVGIGTSSPGNLLQIDRSTSLDSTAITNGRGTLYLSATTNSTNSVGQILNAIGFSGQGTGRRRAMIANLQSSSSSTTGGNLAFYTTSSALSEDQVFERMRIDSSGRLLVGTTTAVTQSAVAPRMQLSGVDNNTSSFSASQYNNSIAAPILFLNKSRGASEGSYTAVSSGDFLGRLFFTGADGTDFIQAASIAAQVDGTPGTNDMPGRLVFSTTADGASSTTERMRIDSAGNVGIGASSTSQKLTVFSGTNNSNIARFTGGQIAKGLVISTFLSNGNDGGVRFTSSDSFAFFVGANEYLRINNGGGLNFGASSALQLDSSGNLGLGVTPSAWATSFKAMQLGAGGYISGRTNTDEVYVGANAYFDTTDNRWEYIATDVATQYYQDAGTHVWRIAPSGTAGNAITFTQAMTLDASGNLGIGTSSPGSYGKLAVQNGVIAAVSADGSVQSVHSAANTGQVKLSSYNAAGTSFLTFGTGTDVERMRIDSSGNVLVTGSGGLGYGTGSGGTVTQATNKFTTVTLNKPTGRITMNGAALAAGATANFALSNSILASSDVLILNVIGGVTGVQNYNVWAGFNTSGSVQVYVRNISASSLSEALVINFAVIKGATA